jgi:hypothetical protein
MAPRLKRVRAHYEVIAMSGIETQLLRIRIKPGKTAQVVEFIRRLLERRDEALDALKREGMLVESIFLERLDRQDYLYYYVKAGNISRASAIHAEAEDPLTAEIRAFVEETWGEISSPEPLLDLDLITPALLEAGSGSRGRLPFQAPE